jgi:UDP-glucuronate 4-epimerase
MFWSLNSIANEKFSKRLLFFQNKARIANPRQQGRDSGDSSAPYKVYNIGNSSPVLLMDYIAAIEKALNTEAKKEFLPMQPGDVIRTDADVSDLIEKLGYKPNTPVSEGIEKFIEWYKSYFKN